MTPETVCAVVVTYNRRELLIECLDALRNQTRPVDAVYLVDNASTDDTPELLLEKGYLDLVPETGEEAWERTLKRDDLVVHYLRLSHNQGGSGGFHQGVKRAYQQGYQWLWLMDDDARPQED
ncbi:MAG TPA: glycosyltransferase, partial [Methanobacteriaceae archaeon]|nr:glycosyltransferase [Methanobacteriaceae archaeon]